MRTSTGEYGPKEREADGRQFLDSGECILTVICAFTDSDTEGGATAIFPHGIKREWSFT